MTNKSVSQLTTSGALTGTELFYADNGTNDVKVAASQIKTFATSDIAASREQLTASRTVYVRANGNDSNDGLTSGSAKLTVQAGVDLVTSYDHGGDSDITVTLDIGSDTYTEEVVFGNLVGAVNPAVVTGTGTIKSTASSGPHQIAKVQGATAEWVFTGGLTIEAAGSGGATIWGIYATDGGKAYIGEVTIVGTSKGLAALNASKGGFLTQVSAGYDITISGTWFKAFECEYYADMDLQIGDLTFDTVTITNSLLYADALSSILFSANNVTGTPTFGGGTTYKQLAQFGAVVVDFWGMPGTATYDRWGFNGSIGGRYFIDNIWAPDGKGILDDRGNEQLIFQQTASAVNHFEITNATSTNAPQFGTAGNDTNIDLAIVPKGSGLVRIGTHSTEIGTGTVTGYITIKDSGGTERKLAVMSTA